MINTLIKKIKTDTWWSEEAPGVPMFCIWMSQFIRQSNYWHPKLPNVFLCFVKNDFIFEETPEKQKLAIWNYVFKKFKKDPQYIKAKYSIWYKIRKDIIKEGNYFITHKSKMSNSNVAKSLVKMNELIGQHWQITWVQETADIFTTYELPKLIKKFNNNASIQDIQNLAIRLSAPEKISFMEHQHLDLLKLAINYYSQIKRVKSHSQVSDKLGYDLNVIANKYIWLLSNYREGKKYLSKDVWQQIKFECRRKSILDLKKEFNNLTNKVNKIKNEKKKLYDKFNIPTQLQSVFELLSYWSGWIDDRKELALRANYYLEFYAEELAKRLGMDIYQVKYLLPQEQQLALLKGKKPSGKILKYRRSFSVFVAYKDKGKIIEKILIGSDVKKLWNIVFIKNQSQVIKGQVASAPVNRINGRVQIVLDPHRDKFISGRILVTTMTRPDFVPLIRRAKAIITDEGGLTCHAAIIARELNIPCIIGTKFASKLIKSKNKVEIDLLTGVVKLN